MQTEAFKNSKKSLHWFVQKKLIVGEEMRHWIDSQKPKGQAVIKVELWFDIGTDSSNVLILN